MREIRPSGSTRGERVALQCRALSYSTVATPTATVRRLSPLRMLESFATRQNICRDLHTGQTLRVVRHLHQVSCHPFYALRNGPGESGSAVNHLVTPETLG